MKHSHKILSAIALIAAFALGGASLSSCKKSEFPAANGEIFGITGGVGSGENSGITEVPPSAPQITPNENNGQNGEEGGGVTATPPSATPPSVAAPPTQIPEEKPQEKPVVKPVAVQKAEYILVGADGVNIRSSAGQDSTSFGKAEKNTLYALIGKSGKWYKTVYKDKTAYIYADYCSVVYLNKSANEKVERVISEGTKQLGVKYVYGAVRYIDANGRLISGFSKAEFDCSSLMQYIFKVGANVNLQSTTRTQIYQGKTVADKLQRGDLMFFTNSSRVNNTGIERIGHVALYLGDNYILHTASDYAKIERISSQRWAYYIQSRRLI